jgi:hypothetical protein
VASTRSQLFENIGGINEPARIHVGLRLSEGRVQSRAVGIVEPVPWVQGQQLQFGALGQGRGFVNYKPSAMHPSLDCHEASVALDVPPNKRLHPTAAARRLGV